MRCITLCLLMIFSVGNIASADQLISPAMLYARVATAPAAIVTAYELPARGGMTAALQALCLRGGRGDVILAGNDFIVGSRVRDTVDAAAAALAAAGCHVRRATVPMHLKLAAIGSDSYLADRNFGRSATIIRLDDLPDRNLIASTLQNQPGSNGSLATLKGQSLAIEARVIADSSGDLDCESESFNGNNVVYDALLAAAQAHRHIRLIVAATELRSSRSETERTALASLARLGVEVRAGRANAKLAVADRSAFFVGSSNATGGYPQQIHWGKRLTDETIRSEIRRRFTSDWSAAEPAL